MRIAQQMNKFDDKTEEELRENLSSLYDKVSDLSISKEKTLSRIKDSLLYYDKKLLLKECINMQNIINTVQKANVINKELGFKFYLRPKEYISSNGEIIIMGTNIVLRPDDEVKHSFGTSNIGRTRKSLEFKIPHSWQNVQLCGTIFNNLGNTITIHFKEINQIDFNSVMMNNMNRIVMITSAKSNRV